MRKNLIIAIDGPAASGKSTTAKKLAEILDYTYIDTGAMYRAAALAALSEKISLDSLLPLTRMLDTVKIVFYQIEGKQKVFLNGKDVSERIREADITKMSSEIAVIPEVRKKLVELQQEMGRKGGVIMDGRDIGTVVFPEADFKFFLKAATKTRALRRWKELLNNKEIALEDVEKDLMWRDENDSNRKVSPLTKAVDAVEIDTTDMSIEEQVNHIYQIIVNSL